MHCARQIDLQSVFKIMWNNVAVCKSRFQLVIFALKEFCIKFKLSAGGYIDFRLLRLSKRNIKTHFNLNLNLIFNVPSFVYLTN